MKQELKGYEMAMEREGGGGGGEGWRAEEGGGRIRVTRKTASSQKNQVRRKILPALQN